jgi:hypothetical protein
VRFVISVGEAFTSQPLHGVTVLVIKVTWVMETNQRHFSKSSLPQFSGKSFKWLEYAVISHAFAPSCSLETGKLKE